MDAEVMPEYTAVPTLGEWLLRLSSRHGIRDPNNPPYLGSRQPPKTIHTMRTLLLTTTAALFLCMSTQAQDKGVAPSNTAVAKPAKDADPLMEQKRQLSGELKTTLAMAEGLSKKAMEAISSAKPEEHEKYMGFANGIKEVQAKVNDQLALVNRATDKEAEGVFARAREVNGSSKKTLEEYKKELATTSKLETKEPVKEQPMTK